LPNSPILPDSTETHSVPDSVALEVEISQGVDSEGDLAICQYPNEVWYHLEVPQNLFDGIEPCEYSSSEDSSLVFCPAVSTDCDELMPDDFFLGLSPMWGVEGASEFFYFKYDEGEKTFEIEFLTPKVRIRSNGEGFYHTKSQLAFIYLSSSEFRWVEFNKHTGALQSNCRMCAMDELTAKCIGN